MVIFQTKIAGFEISLARETTNRRVTYAVRYGEQFRSGFTRTQAAHELGYCIFHALECEGKLDGRPNG